MDHPHIPSLAVLNPSAKHLFITPSKKINEGHDVSTFLMSQAYTDIMTFIMQLNRSMFPTKDDDIPLEDGGNSTPPEASQIPYFSVPDTVRRLLFLLLELERLIDEYPPDPGPRRFGNTSFRKWSEAVEDRAEDMLETYLPIHTLNGNAESEVSAHDELKSYLLGSFGSAQRLDYGTGHELSFLAFLGCIWKLGGFESSDADRRKEERNIVLDVIEPYVMVTTISLN